MGIFDRMGRVISSNVNALLDRAENPRKSIDLLIDEMKEQIRRAREEVVAAVAAEKQIKKKVEELDAEAERWTRRAELALTNGDEALAREALVQKQRVVAERDRAEASRAEQRGAALQMKRELERMEQRQKELEARKGTIAVRASQARGGGGPTGLGAKGGTSAFDEFRRMEEKIEAVETEATVAREVDELFDDTKQRSGMSRDELEARFAALEAGQPPEVTQPAGTSAVDRELEAMKSRIRVKE